MKKSYSALIQSSGSEINQFATISTDGQVLLWEKKFVDAQKKPITDVFCSLFSILWSTGKLAMASTCSDLKEEVLWEDHILHLTKMRRELFSLARLTRANCLFATGRPAPLMRQEARTIPSPPIGTKNVALDRLSRLICFHQTRASSLLFTTSTSAYGRTTSM